MVEKKGFTMYFVGLLCPVVEMSVVESYSRDGEGGQAAVLVEASICTRREPPGPK